MSKDRSTVKVVIKTSAMAMMCHAAISISAQQSPAPESVVPRPVRSSVFRGSSTGSISDRLAMRQAVVQSYASHIYRKPTEAELKTVAPRTELLDEWAAFLALPDTGMVRLLPESGCGENAETISAAERCRKLTMPGGGSSYSFRAKRYRVSHLADLTNTNGVLRVSGLLMSGVIVDLGDQPISALTTRTAGVDYLASISPPGDIVSAQQSERKYLAGFLENGRVYRRSVRAAINTTYALRAIAYRGKVMRAVRGAVFNEMDFDKRRDVIIAFRIVDVGGDGSVTLVWRELSNTQAPKLKIPPKRDVARK